MKKQLVKGLLLIGAVMCHGTVWAQSEAKNATGFAKYVEDIKAEAVAMGYESDWLEKQLAGIEYRATAVKADRNQPEKKITLDQYLDTRVPDWKVKRAVALGEEHRELLDRISQEYGVQTRFILALWGNESNFGKIQGRFPVLAATLSLAYEGRREVMFKRQFFAALDILKAGHIDIDKMKGSWAGAMGQSQFMPTTFMSYAVDYDKDGKKDIWSTPADVFASIANFLSSEGWHEDGLWGRQVSLPSDADQLPSGLSQANFKPLSYWQTHGVRRYDGRDLPNVEVKASLIMPDGPDGRVYLVYNNFHTLMKWNRSSYFGVSVGYLSDRIRGF